MRRTTVIAALLCLSSAVPLRAQSTSDSPGQGASVAGELRLVNRKDADVTVELRLVTPNGCDGAIVAARRVEPGTTIVLRTSQAFCIRRESTGVAGTRVRSAWERKDARAGTSTEVIL